MHNDRTIVSGSEDRTIRFWDIDSSSCPIIIPVDNGITTVAISPDDKFLASGSFDNSVCIWEIATKHLAEQLKGRDGHKKSVYSVAFTPDGKYLVSGSLDKTIKIWEISPLLDPYNFLVSRRSSCRSTFKGHEVNHLSRFCFLSLT
jgi:glucose repression regulatory protein TUP1